MVFSGNFFLTLKRIPLSVTPAPPTGSTEPIDPLLYSFASTTSISDTYQGGGTDIIMSNDGYKLWVLVDGNNADNDRIREYALSTPWDVSTMTLSVDKTIFNSIICESFCFNGDGTKIYVHAAVDSSTRISKIYDFPLSTAYDISTLNTNSVNITSLSPSGDRPGQRIVSMNFNGDGTKIFLTNVGSINGSDSNTYIYVFSLSTPYDVSSLSGKDPYSSSDVDYTVDYSTFAGSGVSLRSWKFVDNGNYLYGVYNDYGGVILDLTSNPYELSSYTIVENVTDNSLDSILDPSGVERGIVFQEPLEAGSKFVLFTPNYLYTRQFNLPALLFSDLSVSNYTKRIIGFDLYFTPSGNKFYTINNATSVNPGLIYEYTMSTNWQPSTAGSPTSYTLVNYNGSVKYFTSFTFNSDGTKLFVISRQNGSSNECDIWRYSLSTGFDFSTASFDGTTRLGKSGGNVFRIESINFNDDGSKVFMLNRQSSNGYVPDNIIYQISLSRSYDLTELSNQDISTYCDASLDFGTLLPTTEPMSFRFAYSGKYIYLTGNYSSTEYSGILIDISVSPYDISSVTSSNILEFTPDTDTELYMLRPLYNSSLPKIFMEPLSGSSSIFLNTGTYVYSRQFNGTNPFIGQSVTPYYEYNIVVTQVSVVNGIAGLTEVHFVDSDGSPQYLYDSEAVLGEATSVPSGTGYNAGDSVSIPINNYQQEATSGRLVWPESNARVNDTLLTIKVPAYYTPSSNMGGIRIYWEMQARRPAVKITDVNGNILGTDTAGSSNTTIRPHARTIFFSYP